MGRIANTCTLCNWAFTFVHIQVSENQKAWLHIDIPHMLKAVPHNNTGTNIPLGGHCSHRDEGDSCEDSFSHI